VIPFATPAVLCDRSVDQSQLKPEAKPKIHSSLLQSPRPPAPKPAPRPPPAPEPEPAMVLPPVPPAPSLLLTRSGTCYCEATRAKPSVSFVSRSKSKTATGHVSTQEAPHPVNPATIIVRTRLGLWSCDALMRLGVGAGTTAGGAGVGAPISIGSAGVFQGDRFTATALDTRRDCRNASAPDPTEAQIDRFRASASLAGYHKLIRRYLYR
jgi:hypothetical protein